MAYIMRLCVGVDQLKEDHFRGMWRTTWSGLVALNRIRQPGDVSYAKCLDQWPRYALNAQLVDVDKNGIVKPPIPGPACQWFKCPFYEEPVQAFWSRDILRCFRCMEVGHSIKPLGR